MTGGLWRSHDAISLATPEAFNANPGLVWQFYSYRRHMALQANPNKAHLALAELARRNPNFVTLSQNVDGEKNDLLAKVLANAKIIQGSPQEQCTQTPNSISFTVRFLMSGVHHFIATMRKRTTSPIRSHLPLPYQNRGCSPSRLLQTKPEQKQQSLCMRLWT